MNRFKKISELLLLPISTIWEKAPIALLLFLYILIALLQWSFEKNSTAEKQSGNNYFTVSQFGSGSVCVPPSPNEQPFKNQ